MCDGFSAGGEEEVGEEGRGRWMHREGGKGGGGVMDECRGAEEGRGREGKVCGCVQGGTREKWGKGLGECRDAQWEGEEGVGWVRVDTRVVS